MFRMGVGQSDDVDLDRALEAVFSACDRGLAGQRPKAGLLFAPPEADHRALVTAVRDRYPGIQLVGATSGGEMSSAIGFLEDSVTLALFASDRVDMTVGLGTGVLADPQAAARQAVGEARGQTDQEPRLCIALPSLGQGDPTPLLTALREELGAGVPILGGGAAFDFTDPQAVGVEFRNDEITTEGVCILLFSGPLSFSFGVAAGWRAVGARGTVTRTSGHMLHEIDGQPAIAFYQRYLGPDTEPARANPLAVFEPGSESFYLRAPAALEPDTGSIRLGGPIAEGDTVQLAMAATDEIFADTKTALSRALERYPQGAEPAAALLFSCMVRKVVLGTRAGQELELTRELFGRALPIAGLYCVGEIAPVADVDTTRFHNETLVAVLLGAD